VIGYDVVHNQLPALAFVQDYANVFAFPNSTLAMLQNMSDTCNYTNYVAAHATYPPKGLLPVPNGRTEAVHGCDIYDKILDLVRPLRVCGGRELTACTGARYQPRV
jgi:carboxypeptidase D